MNILAEIVKYGESHQTIKRFILEYSSQAGDHIKDNDEHHISKGLYMKSLADSIDLVLDPFRQSLFTLEKDYLANPNNSLSYFYTQIKVFDAFFYFLKELINELKAQKYHGCAVLKLMHKHSFHGDPKVMQAIRIIRKSVYAVFLRQLSQWLIYGRLVDVHEEFFIVHSDVSKAKSGVNLAGPIKNQSTGNGATISDTASVNSDLWHYEICYDMLPPNFTPSWAEKVLFIGQTVQMLSVDPRKTKKKVSICSDDEFEIEVGSLWNKQEHIYFNKLQVLYNDDCMDIGTYERIVNEIKLYVTERLSEIAFNQADLIKHLRLVKDYYLLGRGELFLEFIIQTNEISATREGINEHLARDVNRGFQAALNRTFTDLEQLTMCMPLDDIELKDLDDDPHVFLQLINLKFKVKWPLHLFFSPTILKRYNELFRFLLQIRKLQNDLHTVWRQHREKKLAGNSKLSQLRNKLLFLIDNLQYYLQVDVLESQFSILINAVQNSKDFEYIQRAHCIFQANIMSLCFLMNTNRSEMAKGLNTTIELENPVLIILHQIMGTIRIFCNLNATCSVPLTTEEQQQLELIDRM